MDLELHDKVALVTGGSRGIGRAIVHDFAKEGCHVAFSARGEEALKATEREVVELGGAIASSARPPRADAGFQRMLRRQWA